MSAGEFGLVKLSEHAYGYLQEDKGLGWSNSGLIAGKNGLLLVDTLFDLQLTQSMLDEVARQLKRPITRLINTHHNGDHCWGNQLLSGAEIIAHRDFREEMLKTAPEMMQAMKTLPAENPGMAALQQALEPFDFSKIKLIPPSLLFDHRLTLYIDDRKVELLHVGPAHTSTDIIVLFPEERILYAGDIIFRLCTPIGWEGTYEKWIAALNHIIKLNPEKIVPGHGPLCGTEGAVEMREYLQYVYREARTCYDRGMSAAEAARTIDPGPYAGWTEPERIIFNIARAYREFNGEPFDTPVDFMEMAKTMTAIRQKRAGR
jgi:cyclase